MTKTKAKPPAQRLAMLEQEIRELGGTYQKPWPWAVGEPAIRLLQLQEYVEELRNPKLKRHTTI
jgi:hypothetical protein